MKKKRKNVRSIEPITKHCASDEDRTDDEDDETIGDMPGLKGQDRLVNNDDDPKETKTKKNPTSINRGAAAESNQNNQNKSMYNDNDDDANDDIVIMEDVNEEEEENDEPDNRNYNKQGIFETNISNN